jgi:hypothetical protein
VVTQRDRGSVGGVPTKPVFGATDAITARLRTAPASPAITPSLVEREHFTLRQRKGRLPRKTRGFRQEVPGLEKPRWLALADDQLVLPHDRLRQRLVMPDPTRGHGSARRWCAIPPAMAAGLTDHGWTVTAWLAYRVPAAILDRMPSMEHLFPSLEPVHQGN